MFKKENKSTEFPRAAKIIVVVCLAVLVAIVIYAKSITSGGSGTGIQNRPNPFNTKIVGYHAVNPSLLSDDFEILNNSNNVADAVCEVSARDNSSVYTGHDYGYEYIAIPSNKSVGRTAQLRINNEGASFVSNVEVSCDLQKI